MNHEENLTRLITRGEEYLSCAMEAKEQENDIKYHYQLSRFFTIVDQIRKELMVQEYNEELRKAAEELLAIVEQVVRMKDIKDYEGLYAITEDGRVWSYRSKKFLKPSVASGYLQVNLYNNGKRTFYRIHRLVALAYLPNPDNLPEVNHRDENKQNNAVSNLEWCDHSYNINYGTRNERISKAVRCIETGVIYNGTREAGRQTGLDPSSIVKVCKGKLKTCGGYHWEYVDAA